MKTIPIDKVKEFIGSIGLNEVKAAIQISYLPSNGPKTQYRIVIEGPL